MLIQNKQKIWFSSATFFCCKNGKYSYSYLLFHLQNLTSVWDHWFFLFSFSFMKSFFSFERLLLLLCIVIVKISILLLWFLNSRINFFSWLNRKEMENGGKSWSFVFCIKWRGDWIKISYDFSNFWAIFEVLKGFFRKRSPGFVVIYIELLSEPYLYGTTPFKCLK